MKGCNLKRVWTERDARANSLLQHPPGGVFSRHHINALVVRGQKAGARRFTSTDTSIKVSVSSQRTGFVRYTDRYSLPIYLSSTSSGPKPRNFYIEVAEMLEIK